MRLHAKFCLQVSATELYLLLLSVVFDEVFGLFSGYRVDVTDFVSEFYAVELIGGLQELGSEGCGDKLSFFSQFTEHFYTEEEKRCQYSLNEDLAEEE